MKKIVSMLIALAAMMMPALAHAQFAQPGTFAQPGGSSTVQTNGAGTITGGNTTVFAPDGNGVYNNGQAQVRSNGRLYSPEQTVNYVVPGAEGLYKANTVATYANVGIGIIGALVEIGRSRRQEQAPANNGLTECSANGQPSGVFVNNSDGNGVARCDAIFNR